MMALSRDADVTLRPATRADLGDIARIMNYPPEPPTEVLLGAATASRLGALFVHAGISITLPQTVLAVVEGRVAGVMECGHREPSKLTVARVTRFTSVAVQAVQIVGLKRLPRAIHGFRRRQRVSFDAVPDAFPIAELYVDERLRNLGIGGILLAHAEELAKGRDVGRMCLETGVTNPARRLYERTGYQVVITKIDPEYERLTGSPGRILMLKELGGSSGGASGQPQASRASR